MKIVEANPEKADRVVYAVYALWTFLLIVSAFVYFTLTAIILVLYIPITIIMILYVSWNTPLKDKVPWLTTNFTCSLFFFFGSILAMLVHTKRSSSNAQEHLLGQFTVQMVIIVSIFFVASLLVYAIAYGIFKYIRRFRQPYECRSCGYNLTGNVSGRCPECGIECKGMIEDEPNQQLEDTVESSSS